jgi:NAD(P)H:quinone oxidoreductase type IV
MCPWQHQRNWQKPTRSSSALRRASVTWPPKCEIFSIKPGGLWANGALVGKVGSAFASTASQHGGQEMTLVSFHTTLLHHGMIVVGLPYTEQRLMNMAEISGGTPYGATTLADIDGSRQPSENELAIARFQGRHLAQITNVLVAGRKALG